MESTEPIAGQSVVSVRQGSVIPMGDNSAMMIGAIVAVVVILGAAFFVLKRK
jgi:hypothetical protein